MEVINHPFFNRRTFDFDVALLKLQTLVNVNDRNMQEIVMPHQGEPLPVGTPVLVSGWGETRSADETSTILRAVVLEVSNQYECSDKYQGE
jgi:trypsin